MADLRCSEFADCPRCSGCGYGEPGRVEFCQSCADKIDRLRSTCWRCHGTGRVPCEVEPDPSGEPHPHGTREAVDGAVCPLCDKQTPPGPGGCPDCWEPVETIADGKAAFAELGFDTEMHHAP